MLRDDDAVILFDRRNEAELLAQSIGYEIMGCATTSSPIGNAAVMVALLRPRTGDARTRPARPALLDGLGRSSFVKLLDRFYIPAVGDPVISALLFQLIAERYEELTATDVNRRTAEILLRAALKNPLDDGPRKVLDFGCGTGCAVDALKALGREGQDVELLGTDLSEEMLSIAKGRGEVVAPLKEWRAMPTGGFVAAISCFVLHYGVPEEDLASIARQLKPGGIFSANLFKGSEAKLAQLTSTLSSEGLDLISNEQMITTPDSYNRHLLFKKRDGCLAS
ncbi:class I SAM-dependent methyltransferase [Methylocystis iwaonis]|uniref:class I SAM-dependent DNA methyltransferase n=1 Tax=Methylocystis iwaonis TaxID=2885079 RepID=UPI002E7B4192|nr:class I SAM-dependent methyltransferase [Methylocystis iwaonis]